MVIKNTPKCRIYAFKNMIVWPENNLFDPKFYRNIRWKLNSNKIGNQNCFLKFEIRQNLINRIRPSLPMWCQRLFWLLLLLLFSYLRFQRQLYPKMAIRHTRQRGWGLFLEESVKKGDFVIEYVGELISTAEYKYVN